MVLAYHAPYVDALQAERGKWEPIIDALFDGVVKAIGESMGWKTWDVKARRVDTSPRVIITCEIELQTTDVEDFIKKSIDSDPKLKEEVVEQATGSYHGDQDFLIRNAETAVKNRLPKMGAPYG